MEYTKRTVILDLETQKGFHEVDRSRLHLLKVSVVGIFDSYDNSFHCFEEKELHSLEERLKLADLIIGFNIIGFDLKVLTPYLLTDVKRFRVLDLLDEIHKVRGHRVSLQSLAQGTFQDSKSGSGWNAIQMYRDGRIDDLKKYCIDDVRITKNIYEYGIQHKKVFYFSNRDFSVHEIPVTWGSQTLETEETSSAFPSSLF